MRRRLMSNRTNPLFPYATLFRSHPPPNIAGRSEVRNVGLVELPDLSDSPVCLALRLVEKPERLPEPRRWTFAGITVPSLRLHGLEPSAPLKVEHSLRVYGLDRKSTRLNSSH